MGHRNLTWQGSHTQSQTDSDHSLITSWSLASSSAHSLPTLFLLWGVIHPSSTFIYSFISLQNSNAGRFLCSNHCEKAKTKQNDPKPKHHGGRVKARPATCFYQVCASGMKRQTAEHKRRLCTEYRGIIYNQGGSWETRAKHPASRGAWRAFLHLILTIYHYVVYPNLHQRKRLFCWLQLSNLL